MRLHLVAALLAGSGLFNVNLAQQRPRSTEADQQPPTAAQKALRLVQKIYVGDMGDDVEADRFRFLLEEQLSRKGFTVVGRPEEADAVMTGALSVRVFDDKSEARVYVRLESPRGDRLWARDFGNRLFRNPFNRKEPTKLRAEDVANGLRSDLKKATT